MGRPEVPAVFRALRAFAIPLAAFLCGALLVFYLLPPAQPRLPTLIVLAPPTTSPARTTPAPAAPLSPDPTPPPATPTRITLPDDALALEVITLRNDLSTLTSYVLLLKAGSRLQTARLALAENNLPAIQRQLAVAQEDMDMALSAAPEPLKGTIQDLISEINILRDDLAVRPETINSRLGELWEKITILVENTP